MEQKEKDLKCAQQDYHGFSLIFLAVSFFLTIGLWLPEPYQIQPTLWLATVIGVSLLCACSCHLLSYRAKIQLDKLENK
ncbi:hypothetical protein JCM19046_4910 [Bacillus sp. JCM 19046]|uniref:YrhC-like protein n=1 Tax=Shouchella xiaoxiensis TaxID=766895 RepID=A0ABS2SS70_9BACI|nr:hypothetical protein [Shouchella xiaoxiensis]GAF12338.1 hypothetical protein JCM19045_1515 [Bacillus sp. JCM 19045]GAF20203.1 hypothetical protein JCM19046_4910 [Bacillus sp. JCM 19046]